MFILVYGDDGTGKSIQCKSIAENSESALHLSFAVKNRRLYRDSGIESTELIAFDKTYEIDPYKTMDNIRAKVAGIVSSDSIKCLILDEITMWRSWAQPLIIEEINRVRVSKQQAKITKIGEENYGAWARVNEITYGHLELLANWAECTDALVIAISGMKPERMMQSGTDDRLHSVETGNLVTIAKENVRKLADVRILLEKDGRRGRGYMATFQKQQEWMEDGKESMSIGKDGLYQELLIRGVL
jgi:hypothetical protein